MLRWGALLAVVVGLAGAGAGLPQIDSTRQRRAVDTALLFVPEPAMVRVASSGFQEPASDLFWVRTVILFGERFGVATGTDWTAWLSRMVETVTALDPRWRTPYFYGGGILRVAGEIDSSSAIFEAGAEAFPGDPFFPFSVGMNYYLYKHDPSRAADWLERAAASPAAPSWYASAAAAMRNRGGSRAAAISYLRQIRETAPSGAVRADAETQLRRLYHDDLVDSWAAACRDLEARAGRPLTGPEELWRHLGKAHENPRGDAWVVGSDGVLRGAEAEKERVFDLRAEEWKIVRAR